MSVPQAPARRLTSERHRGLDPQGTIRIRTGTRPREDRVEVEIADDGRGIPEEELGRIFEPAFVASASRMKAGFGLFVSRNVVRKHGGEIRVESKPGKGSSFTLLLPPAEPVKEEAS